MSELKVLQRMQEAETKRKRQRQKEKVVWNRGSVFYISLSSCELILTSVEAARSPDTVSTLELHGNKGMIGSGIKGLIHYLFSYGHIREVPILCVHVCVYMCAHMAHTSIQ